MLLMLSTPGVTDALFVPRYRSSSNESLCTPGLNPPQFCPPAAAGQPGMPCPKCVDKNGTRMPACPCGACRLASLSIYDTMNHISLKLTPEFNPLVENYSIIATPDAQLNATAISIESAMSVSMGKDDYVVVNGYMNAPIDQSACGHASLEFDNNTMRFLVMLQSLTLIDGVAPPWSPPPPPCTPMSCMFPCQIYPNQGGCQGSSGFGDGTCGRFGPNNCPGCGAAACSPGRPSPLPPPPPRPPIQRMACRKFYHVVIER
jgi:hypothetical protein